MASRDIDINVNVTFWGDGVLLETFTKSEMADKLNDKLDGFLSTFARNTNCRYSEEKKNIESICPKKELYHIDIDKLSCKKDDDEPICFILRDNCTTQAFLVSKKYKLAFIKLMSEAFYENGEKISFYDIGVRLDDNEIHYSTLFSELYSVDSKPHITFWQAIGILAKSMPVYEVEMGMRGPRHVEIQLYDYQSDKQTSYVISAESSRMIGMDEKED